MTGIKKTFEELGGKPVLEKVAHVFYEKIYAHPWIGQYFKEVPQKVIEAQQVDFMMHALGGPSVYCGKLPIPAHKHLMITEELFDLRQNLLKESLIECAACADLTERWMKIDEAFRNKLIKKSIDDCEPRFKSDEILNFENPEIKKKVA